MRIRVYACVSVCLCVRVSVSVSVSVSVCLCIWLTSDHISSAMPMVSNPGPRLAVVAGTLTVTCGCVSVCDLYVCVHGARARARVRFSCVSACFSTDSCSHTNSQTPAQPRPWSKRSHSLPRYSHLSMHAHPFPKPHPHPHPAHRVSNQ